MIDKQQINKEQQMNRKGELRSTSIQKRNVGLQTIIPTKEYLITSVAVTHNLETDEYPKFMAIPHNISS